MVQTGYPSSDILMFEPLIRNLPLTIYFHTLRQGVYMAKTASVDINEVEKRLFFSDFLIGNEDGIFERDWGRRRDASRLDKHKIVVAIGQFFVEERGIISNHMGIDTGSKPCSDKGMLLQEDQDRIDPDLFKTRGHQERGINACAKFLCEYLIN